MRTLVKNNPIWEEKKKDLLKFGMHQCDHDWARWFLITLKVRQLLCCQNKIIITLLKGVGLFYGAKRHTHNLRGYECQMLESFSSQTEFDCMDGKRFQVERKHNMAMGNDMIRQNPNYFIFVGLALEGEGEPTHTLETCWICASQPPRYHCIGWSASTPLKQELLHTLIIEQFTPQPRPIQSSS